MATAVEQALLDIIAQYQVRITLLLAGIESCWTSSVHSLMWNGHHKSGRPYFRSSFPAKGLPINLLSDPPESAIYTKFALPRQSACCAGSREGGGVVILGSTDQAGEIPERRLVLGGTPQNQCTFSHFFLAHLTILSTAYHFLCRLLGTKLEPCDKLNDQTDPYDA